MHFSLWKYILNILYLLDVSATHVAIFREVHYQEYVYKNITEVFGSNAQT
jgi:hypothetical protein